MLTANPLVRISSSLRDSWGSIPICARRWSEMYIPILLAELWRTNCIAYEAIHMNWYASIAYPAICIHCVDIKYTCVLNWIGISIACNATCRNCIKMRFPLHLKRCFWIALQRNQYEWSVASSENHCDETAFGKNASADFYCLPRRVNWWVSSQQLKCARVT